jgi:hypothetical protein
MYLIARSSPPSGDDPSLLQPGGSDGVVLPPVGRSIGARMGRSALSLMASLSCVCVLDAGCAACVRPQDWHMRRCTHVPPIEAVLVPVITSGRSGQLDAGDVRADRAHLASASIKVAASSPPRCTTPSMNRVGVPRTYTRCHSLSTSRCTRPSTATPPWTLLSGATSSPSPAAYRGRSPSLSALCR